jgi:S-methylmethionine-dependent homocysteine/selenocysteine methylase
LLDGGMGQELLRRSAREATPLWSADIMLKEPSLVRDLHLDFIESGARVITLNTYTATPQRLAREGELGQLKYIHQSAINAALSAVELSKRDGVKIAGCLPPLVASYRPDVSLSFEDSLSAYRHLVELQTPGCDIFLCETMASIDEARAACIAATESGKPVWVALTVSDYDYGLLRSGESLEEALNALSSLGAQATLLNCSHPEAINACWDKLHRFGGAHERNKIGAYANGFISVGPLLPGGTVEQLEVRQDLNPSQYAEYAMGWVKGGASIIGGCCEIGPLHIKALHESLLAEGLL